MKLKILMVILFILVNCSSANKKSMLPHSMFNKQSLQTINVDKVKGAYLKYSSGLESWSQHVDDEVLKGTLIDAIMESGLVGEIYSISDYKLDCEIESLQLDAFYFVGKAEVKSKILYTITKNQKLIKKFNIEEEGIFTTSEESIGGVRVRRAIEQSVQNNLRMFLKEMAKINFDKIE